MWNDNLTDIINEKIRLAVKSVMVKSNDLTKSDPIQHIRDKPFIGF